MMRNSGRSESGLINPQAFPAYIAVLSVAWFIALTAAFTNFSYDMSTMNRAVFALMFLIIVSAWLARRGYKIGAVMEAVALFTSLNFAAPSYGRGEME